MAVFHVLKDGSRIDSVEGYVVKKADADPLYQFITSFNRKLNSSKFCNT